MQTEEIKEQETSQTTTFIRENQEDQVESFLRLNPELLYIPEEIDKELGWTTGMATGCLSRMYRKKKVYREEGHRGLAGRKCFAYRIWRQGDPNPVIEEDNKIYRKEVFEILEAFLKQQNQEEFFSAVELSELDPRFTGVSAHLSSLTELGLLERIKVPKGKNGQKVFGYRLTPPENKEQAPPAGNKQETIETQPGFESPQQLDLDLSASQEPPKSEASKEEPVQTPSSFEVKQDFVISKEEYLQQVVSAFKVKTLEALGIALQSDIRCKMVRDELQHRITQEQQEVQKAQRRLSYSQQVLARYDKLLHRLQMERMIQEEKKLAAGFDDGELLETFRQALPNIPLS